MLICVLLATGCNSDNNINENNVVEKPKVEDKQIILDKTYYSERFNFEINYPSEWSIFEERNEVNSPDQGVYLYFDKNRDYYICAFGQISHISVPENDMEKSDFITNDGVKGIAYTHTGEIIDIIIVFNDYYGYHGLQVKISKELNEIYKEDIQSVLKSLKINKK